MESMSAVTGPMITGPRGAFRPLVIDLVGSIRTVGLETPAAVMPDDEIKAWPTLLDVAGPALRKPPSILPPITTALPASGLLPRVLKFVVPISEIAAPLTKEPPELPGQVKPDGAAVSL